MITHTAGRRMLTQAMTADFTRRSALRGLGGALAAAVALGTGSRRAWTQDATPAVIPPLFQEWKAAWESGDPVLTDVLYAADAVLEDVTAGAVFRGREEVEAHIADLLAGFPDHAYEEILSAFVAGDRAAAEWRWSATYTGTFPGLPPGTGQAITLRGAVFIELANGLIRREAHYYDAYSFLIQLGVLPAPGAAATPEAG